VSLDDCYSSFINLDSRPDRLAHMQRELERVGIKAVRTRGILPEEYDGDPAKIQVMLNRTPGAIGCWLAQTQIMREAWEKGQSALVMEDDLVFCSDFQERMEIASDFLEIKLSKISEYMPWDVFWLGGTYHVNPPVWHKDDLGRDAERTKHPRIVRTFGAFSTHAYYVRYSAIPGILKLLDGIMERSMGIDWAFIQLQPHLLTYAFAPGCVIQYDNASNIGNGVTVFSKFAELGAHWFADRMEDFDPDVYDWGEAG
jgi:GR25 family glycosyltransferase involved in LPS biosynthesis